MSDFEKAVYNCWLVFSRAGAGKPYRLRKNWEGFEEKREYIYVKKLANFFRRHDNIDMNNYFRAPYTIYNELVSYDLKFYNSMKAMKCYKIYNKKLKDNS